MWSENHKSGKINFVERYRDPYTGKWKKASVLMEKDTPSHKKTSSKNTLMKKLLQSYKS